MPVKGRQQYNLKPVKKGAAVPKVKEEKLSERTSMMSERSSLKSTTSNPKMQDSKAPAKKKITQAQLERAKQERMRMQVSEKGFYRK